MDRLMTDHKYKQEDLTRIIGKSKSTISETLSLNRLPKAAKDKCRKDRGTKKDACHDCPEKTGTEHAERVYEIQGQLNPKEKKPF